MAEAFRDIFDLWFGGVATLFPADTVGALYIAGVDRTLWLKVNTGSFRRAFNQRSSFNCVLEDQGRGYVPARGSQIYVLFGSDRIFAGFITSVRAKAHPKTLTMFYEIEATDNNLIADRRLVYARDLIGLLSIGPGYAGDIVKAIVANGLSGEGIDTSGVEDGPFIVAPLTFFYETVTAALNKVSQAAGASGVQYRWRIDEYRALLAGEFSAVAAPFGITSSTPGWRSLSCTFDLKNYRNTQHARTETNLKATKTETFVGDGVTGDFFIGFVDPVSANGTRWMAHAGNSNSADGDYPTITLDGAPLTVGRLGTDGVGAGFNVTYDVDGIGIHFLTLAGQTIPGAGQIISVTYNYTLGNVVTATDAAEIAARQAVEGGSGIWENIDEQRNIASGQTLTDIASGDLELYGFESVQIEYEIDDQGLAPGQTQSINLPAHGVVGDYLITAIDTQWIAFSGFQFRHKVTLTDIGPMAGPQYVLEKLAETARIGVPRVSAVRTDIVSDGGGAAAFAGRQSDGSNGNYMQSQTVLTTMNGNNGPFTFAFWVKVNGLSQANKVAVQYSDLTGTFQIRVDYNFTVASKLAFFAANYTGADPSTGSGITPPDTDWHHICYRKAAAGASEWAYFLDGVKSVINASINFTLSGNMQYAFMFADRANQFGGVRNFVGSLAEWAVWPGVSLSDSEIAQLAAITPANTVHAGGLVDYWPVGGSQNPEPNVGSDTVGLDVFGSLPPA